MGRGPSLQRVKQLAKAEELGKLKAQQQILKSKPWKIVLRETAEHMLDKVDPLELMAVLAATVIIHEVIIGSATALNTIKTWAMRPESLEQSAAGKILYTMLRASGFGFLTDVGEFTTGTTGGALSWCISFALAYIAIKHASGIMMSLGSLSKWVLGFFAA